ncbi:MAG: hypothetical protein WDO15_16365 [Bacteroidota bacterium]
MALSSEFELTYIISGRGIRYVGNGFEYFEENDLVLLGPNVPHCWKNTGTQTTKSAAIVIHWNNNLIGNNREFDAIAQLFSKAQHGIKYPSGYSMKIKEKLLTMLKQPSFEKLLMLFSILNRTCKRGQRTNTQHDCRRCFRSQLRSPTHQHGTSVCEKSLSGESNVSTDSFGSSYE